MSPVPLLTVSVFVAQLAAAIQTLLFSITGPLTVPMRRLPLSIEVDSAVISVPGSINSLESSTVSVVDRSFRMPLAFGLAAVDFGSMLDFPAWTETAFSLAGLVLLVLGLMAWLGSHSGYRRAWGRRMAFSGGGLFVVGTAFGTFVDLLQYVLG